MIYNDTNIYICSLLVMSRINYESCVYKVNILQALRFEFVFQYEFLLE